MTASTVDDIRTSDLAEDMTIGKVAALLEDEVRAGADLELSLRNLEAEHDASSQRLAEWRGRVHATLSRAFSSGSPALRFAVSRSFLQYEPRIVGLHETFSIAAKALLDIQARHLEKREEIARVTHELATEIAHRKEISDLLRDNHSMTEGLWDRMVKDQFAAPSITRMLGLGVAPEAIWETLKAAGGWFVG